jgi:DNA-binding protein H-NS
MGYASYLLGETVSKSLAQIRKEIEALQRQAEVLKHKEAKDVIARIKEAIAHYGLTAADLGLAGNSGARRGRAAVAVRDRAKTTASKVKYRDEAGNTWSGHGRRPKWFIDAVAGGKSPEQLLA